MGLWRLGGLELEERRETGIGGVEVGRGVLFLICRIVCVMLYDDFLVHLFWLYVRLLVGIFPF